MFKKSQMCTAALVALGGSVFAVSALAQTSERIEVTGSRIRQIESETSQPVQVVTAAQIQASGLITVGDIVNAMSSAGTPAFSKGSVLTSNREQGGQYINLRNLGAQRLLVLVNGKRWTQTVAGYTDMSTVPSALVERIEVLKDGASAIYGSDAIAGVANIILKKSLQGGSTSVYYGENQKGDGQTTDFSLSYGATSEKSSLMFGLTYSRVDPVWAKDRDITKFTYGPDHATAALGTSPWGRVRSFTTAPSGAISAAGFNKIINHTGTYDGVGTSQSVRGGVANFHDYTGTPDDTYNSSQDMMFQSPTELKSIFTKGTLDITPNVRLNTTVMFADRSSSRQIAGYPLSSTSQAKFPVLIDKDSYYNPYGNSVVGAGLGQDVFFYRRTIEVPRVTRNDNKTFHADGGVEGSFKLGGSEWSWNTTLNYSKVSGTTTSTGNINLLNLKKALGPSFLNAAGQVQCGTAAAPIALTECVPFDILGGPSTSSAKAFNYIMSVGQGTYGSIVRSYTADIAGDLFKLPAGAVGVAAGVEHRNVRGYDRPGQFEQSGYSTDLAANTTVGEYTAKEGYIELNVPLLKNVPFAEALSINLAARNSKYSNYGSTSTSKGSFQWRPVKELMVRGTVAEGFRAPTLGDTFGGGSQSFDSYTDPCDTAYGAAKTDAAVAAACTAAGVPAGFRQKNQAGNNIASSAGGQTPTPFNAGAGNASLTPETATTKTLGVVFSPSFMQDLTVSLDWYKVAIENRITAISAGFILNQCYVSSNPFYCGLFTRDAVTGQVNQLNRGNINQGELQTEGIDVGFNLRLPASSLGRFTLRNETTYVKSFRSRSSATAEFTEYVGEYPYYRVRSNFGVDWSKDILSATYGARYYGRTQTQCWNVSPAVECNDPTGKASWGTGVDNKGGVIYHDLSVGVETPWKGKLLVGSNNVFNKKPRVVYDASSNLGGTSSSSSVDPDLPIDRFFFVRYNQKF